MATMKTWARKGSKLFGAPSALGKPPTLNRAAMNGLDASPRNLNDYAKATPLAVGKPGGLSINQINDDPRGDS
jgi:hypothetical protein